MRIKIVGIKYSKNSLVENEIVSFVHESDNPHDPNAIAVINSDGCRAGYVATENTLSAGNRRRGCVDNVEFLSVLKDSTIAVVDKVYNGSFGYADIQ